MQTRPLPIPPQSASPAILPGVQDADTLAAVQSAFEIFERQSRQLEKAYRALEADLACSNKALQERNIELTATNQALRQVSSRLESVLESMTDGLLVVGEDRRIERCNSTACRMLQEPREGIEQACFADIIDSPASETNLEQILLGGSPLLDHPWAKRQDQGETRRILLSLAPVTAPDGKILGAICNLRDVTEFRRMEKRLQSQERLAALGEMAASVAHEIRNPLGTIEGFARLLRRDLAAMPAPLRLAERIVEGAQNLNYVITNLLTYARPMHLQVAPVSVATIFAYCRETLEDRAARTGVCLVMNSPEPDIAFRGDYRQITQAILNLGINAIEACEASGTVHISATETHNTVSLHVRDNGCGMDALHVSKVFDPFFTSKEGGTGLGLSLSRKIIDIHGGEITITSAPGEGSLFSVELPKTGAEA